MNWFYSHKTAGMRIKLLESLKFTFSVTKVTIWMGLAQFAGYLAQLLSVDAFEKIYIIIYSNSYSSCYG